MLVDKGKLNFVELGEAMHHLMQTNGWACLKKWIDEERASLADSLLHCSLTEVDAHRAKIVAYNAVIDYVERAVQQKKEIIKKY